MLNKKSVIISIIFIVSFLIYSNSINSPFHYDDFSNFAKNPDTIINNLSLESLKRAAFTDVSGFRPVSYLSFALNYYFFKSDTASYHIINILIHILNAFLVYLIILILLGHDNKDEAGKERIKVCALFTALIWLTLPANSQAVIFVVQRMALLMSFFFLLSFYTYLLGRANKKNVYFVLSAIFYILSVLSKQNGVILPFAIVVYELTMARKESGLTSKQKSLMFCMLLLVAALLLLYKESIISSISGGYKFRSFTMYERLLTQSRVILFYLSLILLPLPGRLSLSHVIIKSTSPFSPVSTLFSILFIFASIVFAVLRAKKNPYLSFSILFFFVTISVESTILPLEQVFEHRMYLPCIFLIGSFVNFVTEKFYEKNRLTVVLAFSVIVILWGTLTFQRGKVWENDLTLWTDVYNKYPDSSLGLVKMGNALILSKDYDQAEKILLRALEAQEYQKGYSDLFTYNNLGYVYLQKGEYKKSIEMYKKFFKYKIIDDPKIPEKPDYAESYLSLGNAYFYVRDNKNAFKNFKNALDFALKENAADKLGRIYNNMGVVSKDLGNYSDAFYYFKKAAEYYPGNKTILQNLDDVRVLLNR